MLSATSHQLSHSKCTHSKQPGTMGTLERGSGFVPGLVTVPEVTKGQLSSLGRQHGAERMSEERLARLGLCRLAHDNIIGSVI